MPHSRSLLRVARRIASNIPAAEDLLQETLLRAWRSFDQFEPGTNARAWLFRIMFNAFYAQGRKVRSGPVLVPLDDPAAAQSEVKNGSGPSWTESAAIAQALEGLSDEHRTVLMLGVVEGFTCREISAILSVPIGTVMSRLSRARHALREQLAPAGPEVGHSSSRAACAEREAS